MRMSMARSVMRLGPVHVVVVVPSAPLRAAVVTWLRTNKRVRIVRAAATVAELGAHRLDCDLVVASALDGPRQLRDLSRRFSAQAGLVALSIGTTALPVGWAPVRPGAAHNEVLDHARAHPERTFAKTSSALAATFVAVLAVVLSTFWVPETSVSFERAALAYAARYPDAGTWWHIWGSGAPFLASASWPLLRLAAAAGGGPEIFVLLSGVIGAAFGITFLLLALRLGAGRWSVLIALAAVAPPALWLWPRIGDVTSLVGLTGVAVALAGSRVGRMRFLVAALGVAASSFGGILWVLAAAVVTVAAGLADRRARTAGAGAILGIFASFAVTMPPILARGVEGLRPPLARTITLSDVVPVAACLALVAMVTARGRLRPVLAVGALAVLVGANLLAFQVRPPTLEVARIRPNGGMARLAVHPLEALSYAALEPDLPTTGGEVSPDLMLGAEPKATSNARLEWLGADRAVFPDRSSAIIFNERDWSLLDRDKLLFSAPAVRPILTAGITPTLLVIADDQDARVFADAIVQLGVTSDRVIPVSARRTLDELYQDGHADRETLRDFTMLVIYGQPWRDVLKAEAVLDDYLALSGFVFMDAAGRAGRQPLLPEAHTVRATDQDTKPSGDAKLIVDAGFDGRAVAMEKFTYRGDPNWEQAALTVDGQRVIQYGQSKVAGDVGVSAHLVWSGVDLPARAARGDETALAQLGNALTWMLGAAEVAPTTGYGRPDGDVLESEIATSTFLSPTHWRIELKVATTGVLFKERFHEQWRAFQVDTSPLTRQETRTPLKGLRPTAQGFMYVTLPPNARTIDFVFERHPFESATRGVSGIAVFIVAGLALFIARRP